MGICKLIVNNICFSEQGAFFHLGIHTVVVPSRLSMRQSEKCPVTWHHSVCFQSPSSGHSWSAMTPFTWFAALNAACLLHCGAVLSSEAEDGGSPAWCLPLRLPLKQQKWPLSGPQWEQIARKYLGAAKCGCRRSVEGERFAGVPASLLAAAATGWELLRGLRGVVAALVKNRKSHYESARKKERKKKWAENIRGWTWSWKHLWFSALRVSCFPQGTFFPVASDVASNNLQCHKQIDV